MNLVEISEMLKGAPDTYLTKHVQSPDGSVPQYLALAELQRRQDMRARFAQQNPQSTVAEDATKGIAAAAPGMTPQAQGFAEGGQVGVQDSMIDKLLRQLGLRNLPSEKAAYERTARRAEQRLADTESSVASKLREHRLNMQREEDRALAEARSRMAAPPQADPLQAMIAEREALLKMTPEQRAAKEAADSAAFQKAEMEAFLEYEKANPEEFKLGFRTGDKMRRDPGYKEGGRVKKPVTVDPYYDDLVNAYIGRAGLFESGNNRNAKNPYSTATGRFQMLAGTRRAIDKEFGFDPNDRSDETELARMKAYTQKTINALEKSNIPVTGGTLYGGHFLGQKGITDFFEAYRNDPNKNVSEHFSAEIIRKNPAIFNPRGGKPRTTLAEVMEKFDKVGNSKMRTPRSDEDIGLGAAMQVAKRADRGDVGPYEDMNMDQAMALATLLEKSKLGEGPLVGYPQTQREPPPSFFYTPIDKQIRESLLAPYMSPGIAGGTPGFADGGPVGLIKQKQEAERLKRLEAVNQYRQSKGLEPLKSADDITFTDTSNMMAEARDEYYSNIAKLRDAPYSATSPAGRFGEAIGRGLGGAGAVLAGVPYAAASLVPGALTVFDPLYDPEFQKRQTPVAKRPAPPSPFFANPALTEPKGVGSGILGGGTQELIAPSVAPETAPPAGAPPTTDLSSEKVPPISPPQSQPNKFDQAAEEFLNELKANRMSKDEMRQMALLQAGLGMMAGQSPNFMTNVGQGAMAGLQAYQQAKAQNQALASEAYKNMMAARAFGLDERRVAAAEADAVSQANYRREMIQINKSRADAAVNKLAPAGLSSAATNLLSQIVQAEMANMKELGKEISDKTLAELVMSRADIVRAAIGSGGIDDVSDANNAE